MGTMGGHVFSSYPCIRYHEDSEDKRDYLFFWSSHLLLSHLQLKNATPDGASGQFQGYVSSFSHLIIFLHGENSQILFLLLFISKKNILAWADFVWQVSVPCEFFMLEL